MKGLGLFPFCGKKVLTCSFLSDRADTKADPELCTLFVYDRRAIAPFFVDVKLGLLLGIL